MASMTMSLRAYHSTLAESVYEALKRDLIGGVHPPGAALLSRELLPRYGCGISPLREALARLVGEGLLEAVGHRGVRVPRSSLTDLEELYRIRTILECEALGLAMAQGDDRWEAAAVAACHRLERAHLPSSFSGVAERSEAVAEWERRHRAFHTALIAAAGKPRLLNMVERLVDNTERYRALRLLHGRPVELSRDIVAEHRALLDATLGRTPRALELLAEHLDRTRRFVADFPLDRGEH